MTVARRWRNLLRGVVLTLAIGVFLLYVPLPMLPASVLGYRQALVILGVVGVPL